MLIPLRTPTPPRHPPRLRQAPSPSRLRDGSSRPRPSAPTQARRPTADGLRPVLDVLIGVCAAATIGAHPLVIVLHALASPIAVSAAGGYGAPSLGASARIRTALRLCIAATVSGWLATIASAAVGRSLSFSALVFLWLTSVVGWGLTRAVLRRLERRSPERVVVLGSGVIAQRMEALITRFGEERFELIGFVDEDPAHLGTPTYPWLGGSHGLHDLLEEHAIERVIVAFSAESDAHTMQMIRDCDRYGVQIDVVPRMYEFVHPESSGYSLGDLPLVSIPPRMPRPMQRLAKRAMDVCVAGVLLLLTAPLQALVALLVVAGDRGPALYRQKRIGRDGRPFEILKFRSMRVASDREDAERIEALRRGDVDIANVVEQIKGGGRDPRVTRVGALVRRTSVDELPQLWNVLRGDMSLVGPRPLRPFEVEALQPWERTRLLERPGITGLWQVTGRSEAHWSERMLLDYSYVRHWSFSRDLEILARTVRVVLAGNGAR